ncbi:conjugal transfer protein (plasmid) [Moraxella bovoculi]|nr:conjugal transfer protein [Moraxella bovoculi]
MMKQIKLCMLGLMGMMALLFSNAASANGGVCVGKFANPITDVCWSCIFPLSIGGHHIYKGGQEDNENPKDLLCACSTPPTVGIQTGFWEPVRRLDVTRKPYCMVSLGGIELDLGFKAPEGRVAINEDGTKDSFWQAHWYVDPLLYILDVLVEHPCIETGDYDVGYMTEIDPLWDDDELNLLLNPDVFLFSNPAAQAVCIGDCVKSSTGFGSNNLYWCAGCNGSLYPMNGRVASHVSLVQASSLVAQRMTAKMHRQLLTWGTAGRKGMCGPYVQPIMQKDQYKYSMLYPVPQTKKINGSSKCCQPFGRTTAGFGAGRSYPYKGEDFSYLLFRKKNCCLGPGL